MSRVDVGLLLRLRNEYKRLDQLTWTIRHLQERFPLGTPENEEQLVKNYLALALDIEDILDAIKQGRKDYENGNKK